MGEAAMIQIEDLTKTYVMGEETVTALDSVSLTIARGESIAIIGPSGSGKSTLMNLLGGLDRPSGGRYRFEGEEVARFSDDQLADFRNRRIGFVFQSFQLLPRLSALQNVELPMIYGGQAPRVRRERTGRPGLAHGSPAQPAVGRAATEGGHRPFAGQPPGPSPR
jgi:putative ABC transport system ATP-binding protein